MPRASKKKPTTLATLQGWHRRYNEIERELADIDRDADPALVCDLEIEMASLADRIAEADAAMYKPNPPIWLAEVLGRNWTNMASYLGGRGWMPLAETATNQSSKIVLEFEEYGCGVYGCVIPTQDRDVVFKVTSDTSEVEFFRDVLPTLGDPADLAIVTFYDSIDLVGEWKHRPIAGVWRESADQIGYLAKAMGAIPDLIHIQKDAASMAYHHLHHAKKDAPKVYAEALRQRERALEHLDGVVDVAVMFKARMTAWEKSGIDILALLLALHELTAEALAVTELLGPFGKTLLTCLEHGVVLGDVHADNLGLVVRGGEELWVVTDPGQVAVLGKPWRPPGALLEPPRVLQYGAAVRVLE